jgi:hypothetical protein
MSRRVIIPQPLYVEVEGIQQVRIAFAKPRLR